MRVMRKVLEKMICLKVEELFVMNEEEGKVGEDWRFIGGLESR